MTDLSLSALWQSTRALHERFGVPCTVDVSERLVAEESYELLRASFEADYISIGGIDADRERMKLTREAVDLIVVTLALLEAHGVSEDDLAQAMAAVIAKNDAKTHETHALVNGKITRRSSAGGHETGAERTTEVK